MKSFGRISVAKIYNGTNSISVDITANSQVFISYDRGETFTPDIIKLTPNCQGGANFKSWQYSTDNGATWKALSNNTHDCTIDNKTHVLSIKHFSDIFGVGNMVSIRANIVENESTYDVFSIAKIYDGSAMTDGYNSEVVYLYKRSTTVPTIDWTETLNYNFTIKGLTTTPNGWSTTIPDGSDPLYVTSASAFSREVVDDIEPSEWTTPVLFKDKRSVTGIVNKYMVSALSEGVKTSDSGWKDTIPEMNSNKKYLWNYKIITYDKAPTQEITNPEVIGIYGGNGSSVTYQVGDSGTNKPEGEWTETIPEVPDGKYLWTKVMMQQSDGSFTESYSVSYKGTSGSNGLNNAIIYLYKRAKSAPAAPSTNVTYNFTNHTATGDDIAANKWRQTIPDGSDPIYITTATALNTEDTDIIEPSEWSEPQILSQNGSSISILRSSVTYQVGFSGTNRPTNDAGWTETIPETEAGKYLWTRTIVEYSDGTTTESYGVSYRSLDGTNGNDGRGVSNTSISYQVSDSGTEKPATWKAEIPEIPAGKYLWTKTVITYTDGKSSEIYSVSRSAKDGTNGKGISKVTEYYLASNKSEGITTKDTDWNINVPTMTPTKRFLWNYEKTIYTDNTETNTTPAVIGVYGESGVGIKSITNYYKISNKNTDMSVEDTDWNTTPEPTTPDKPYLWNYELTVFTDNTNAKTKAHIIGTHGIAGVSITNVENWYLATGKDLGVTVDEKGWSKNIKDHPLTRINKYLWNYEKTILSDGSSKDTDPCIIGMYTEDGKGISNITEQYAVSNSATQIPLDSEWKNEIQTMTAEKRYLWNKETITYTDNSSHTTDAKVIGVYGDKGDDGTSVVKVINKYLATNLATGVTNKTAGWTNEIQTISESKKYLWNYEITQLSNGTELATEPCIIGTYAKDGKGISSIVEKYAVSDSNTVTPTTWADQVQTMTATKRYLWNYEIITYTDKSIKETDARVIGVYGRDGKNGVSITGVVNKYLASSKSTGITIDGNTWSNDVQPLNATNKYLWNYEITSLSDGTSITTDPCVIGTYSVDGVGIDHITEQYAISNNNATAPTESQWKDTVQQMTSTNRYLWNREKIYYTDNLNTPKVSEARVIGVYGETGKDGKGISSIVTHYLATSASSGVTKDTTGWKETAQKTNSTNKYLWSYQTITYTDKTVDNTVPVIIGTYGEKGDSITIKSTSVTYQLASSGTEEPTGAWLSYVPDSGSGEYLWTKTTVIYSDDTEVNSFSVSYNGVNAKEGYETSVIYLYKRSKTVPIIDWTEKLTFNFATEKLVKEPRGWSQTIPSGTDTLYVTTATAFAQTITDTIEYTEWTTPIVYNKVRTNTKIENFYIASNKSNGISLSTSGWSTTFPALDDNNKYLWSYTKYTYDEAPLTETSDPKIIAIYGGNGSSVTYQVGNSGTEKPTGTWLNTIPNVPDGKYLWTKIVMMLSDGKSSESYSVSYKGKDGVNGINTATIYLYKRLETIPDKPSSNITYNFETSAATGEDISSGNWYLSIPGGNKPVYVITATAASTENTDIILPTEWSEPQILSKNGESISIESSSVEYQIGISGTTKPTNEYGWTKDVPEVTQGQFLWSRTTVNYSDGTSTVSYNVSYIGNDGVSITEVINWYLASDQDSGVTISTKGWDKSVANTPLTTTNKYLWNYEETIFSNGKNKQTEPCIIGTYSEDGKNGVGISGIAEKYAVSNSNETAPTDWKDAVPKMTATNKYLWNYEIISYTDGSTPHTTKPRVIGVYGDKGDKGEDGKSIVNITNYYLATSANSGVTRDTVGWTPTIQTVTKDKKYLWNYEITTFSKGEDTVTTPCIIGMYGENGKDGVGISGVKEQYYASSSSATAPTESQWKDTVQQMTATNKFLWNREIITYTDKSTHTTDAKIIGIYGDKGDKGADGVSVTNIVTHYLATSAANGVTKSTSGWTTAVQNTDATKKYLWSYQTFNKSSGSPIETDPCIIGTFGQKGESVTIKSTSITYQKSTSGTETPTTWVEYIPDTNAGEYLWTKTTVVYSDGKSTDSYSVSYNGMNAKEGYESAVIYLFKRATSVPTVDWKDTLTYDFVSGKLNKVPNGWSTTVPNGNDTLYVTTASAFSMELTDDIKYTEWTTPMVYKQTRTNTKIENFYLASDKSDGITTSTTGWSTTVPNMNNTNKYLWMYEKYTYDMAPTTETTTPKIISIYGGNGSAVTYQVGNSGTEKPTGTWLNKIPTVPDGKYLWTKIVISLGDGKTNESYSVSYKGFDGNNGLNTATIYLYKRFSVRPSKPTSDITYNFKTHEITGDDITNRKWNVSIPEGVAPIYVITGTALSQEITDVIPPSEWSEPQILSQNGTSVTIEESSVTYQVGISGTTKPTNEAGWTTDVPEVKQGQFLWTKTVVRYSDGQETTSYSVSYHGNDGISVSDVTNWYLASNSSSGVTINTEGWDKNVANAQLSSEKKYLWNYEETTLSDGSTRTTDPCVIGTYGDDGNDGVGIDHIDEQYKATNSNTTAPTEWGKANVVDTMTSTNRYLWNREIIYYTNGKSHTSTPKVIGVYGDTGKDGNGIKQITNYYLATSLANGVTTKTAGWTTTTQSTTASKKYLWNYQLIEYTDTSKASKIVGPCIIGTYGDKGDKGDSIKITSQSVSYKASSSGTEQPTSGWQSTIPELNSGEYLWTKTTVVYSDGTKTESFSVAYNGINAKEGYESAVVYLYKRATSVPTIDWKDTLYYNFTTSKLDKIPSGWSDTVPSGSGTLYVTTASAFSKTITDDIDYTEWTTPVAYNNTRTNTKIENFYLVSDKSSGITTSTSGWSTTIPNMTNNKKYLWSYKKYTYDIAPLTEITTPEIISIYGGNGSSVTYQVGNSGTEKPTGAWLNTIPEVPDGKYLWTKIVILLNDGQVNESYSVSYKGIDGNNGLNTATVYLYKRSASAPNKPTTAITYNFKTKTLTGNDVSSGNWSTTIPSGNTPIYIINATAANVGETDVIEATEWSAPQILSQNGTSVSVDRSVTEYQVGISGTIKPSNEAGWTTTMPEVPKGKFLWTRTTVYYTDGKSTISYAVSYQGVDGLSAHVINHYLATSAKTGVTVSTPGWTESVGTQNFNAVNRYLWNYEESLYSDGTPVGEPSTPAIISVYTEDGKSVEQIEERYAASNSNKTAPDDSKFGSTVPDLNATTSKYLWNYEIIHYIKEGVTSTSTTKKRVIGVYGDKGDKGDKGNDGTNGIGISQVIEYYLATNSASGVTTSTAGWSTDATTQVISSSKKYLWNYEVIKYTNNTYSSPTQPIIIGSFGNDGKPGADGKPGTDGTDGRGISKIENFYKVSASSTGVAIGDSDWGAAGEMKTTTETNKYLWNYEKITYTKGDPSYTQPRIIGTHGTKGSNGTSVTITAKEIKYAVSDSGTNPPTTESSWVTNVPTVANGKFLWTRTKVTYSQGDPLVSYSVSYKAKDGTSGSPGAEGKGYTILLSNEAHTFVVANPSATTLNDGQSTTTSVKAWRNTTSVNVNVTKVNDTAVSGNATVTVNNVVFTVSGNNTANAIITIKPTAKAALTGSFKFTISIDGLSFEKVFSYASSCPGTKGDKGDPGTDGKPGADGKPGTNGKDAYSVKLISSSQIFKSSDGGVTFTPNTITITPVYQNCSHSKWEFSIDGGATWNYVWQNTDFVVDNENTHTLTISSSSSVFTKDVTAVSLKCTTDKENVYDVITIAKIYDVNDLVIGGRNFLSLITGDIGYCLRGYNPIKASDGSVDSTKCLDISVDSENGWISIFGKNNNTTNNLNIFYIVNRTDINLVGGTYILSVEWKSSGKYPLFVTTNNSSKAVSTFVLPITDKKLTFSVDENTVIQYVGIQIPTGTVISEDDKITFRCQLEQGTVVTDWKLDPIDLNQKYIESSSKVQSLTQSYSKFQAIFDSNKLTAESNINDTIKNLNDAINGTDSTQGIIARLNDIYNDPDNALKKSTHLFEFSTWKTSKDGLEALIGKIDENTSSLNELKVKNDGLTSTVTDLTTKGVLACMDFDADHGLTIQTPKKIGQEGGDTQARIVIDGDSVEGFSGNDERQFLIGNDGVQCKSLIVNGTTTIKNGLSFNYIKMRDYIAPMADSDGNRINGLDFTAVS